MPLSFENHKADEIKTFTTAYILLHFQVLLTQKVWENYGWVEYGAGAVAGHDCSYQFADEKGKCQESG